MAIDALEFPHEHVISCDVCIVGSGPAGMTVARELLASGLNIVLCEAGGADYDDTRQALYRAESVGLELDAETTRLRQLGGSSNHWGGRSNFLAADDFVERAWIPFSGWPITAETLQPFHERAKAICQLPDRGFDAASWETAGSEPLELDPAKCESRVWQFSPPTRFGEVYGPEVEAATNATLLLNANLFEIVLNPHLDAVESLTFVMLGTTRTFQVKPRFVVLACGGIENARLLLASRRQVLEGVGNTHGLVGRFLMGHPVFEAGRMLFSHARDLSSFYTHHLVGPGLDMEGFVRMSAVARAAAEVASCDLAFYVESMHGSDGMRAARKLWRNISRGTMPDNALRDMGIAIGDMGNLLADLAQRRGWITRYNSQMVITVILEQTPNLDSRITLSKERDVFGMPLAHINWEQSERERRAVRVALETFASEIGRLGFGRLKLADWLYDDTIPMPDSSNSAHHMGTTRMSAEPDTGVVDADCKVHSLDNLFIAGSSVFPTCGSSYPTLNLVTLAIRLADHLKTVAKA